MTKLLIPILLVALILAAVGTLAIPKPEAIPELPLTYHAENDHAGQYSAATILPRIGDRSCRPILVHACQQQQVVKWICQLKPDKDIWGGVIVGFANPEHPEGVVITGFAARLSYWKTAAVRDGCTETVMVP